MADWIERLVYSVEVFHEPYGSLVEVLARVSDLDIASATFEAARQKHPEKHIALCRKAQIVESTW